MARVSCNIVSRLRQALFTGFVFVQCNLVQDLDEEESKAKARVGAAEAWRRPRLFFDLLHLGSERRKCVDESIPGGKRKERKEFSRMTAQHIRHEAFAIRLFPASWMHDLVFRVLRFPHSPSSCSCFCHQVRFFPYRFACLSSWMGLGRLCMYYRLSVLSLSRRCVRRRLAGR